MTVDVFRCWYEAACEYAGVPRRAALVTLTYKESDSRIRYIAAAAFFPDRDQADPALPCDARVETVLYAGRGKRSKAYEDLLLDDLRAELDEAAETLDARIFWDQPLGEAQLG